MKIHVLPKYHAEIHKQTKKLITAEQDRRSPSKGSTTAHTVMLQLPGV